MSDNPQRLTRFDADGARDPGPAFIPTDRQRRRIAGARAYISQRLTVPYTGELDTGMVHGPQMATYHALVIVLQSDDADAACDAVGCALDLSDIPDGTTYFVGTPWQVSPADPADPVFSTDEVIAQR